MKKPVKKVKKVSADSAFTEGVQEESFREWIVSKFDAMFVDNIPLEAIKELPPRYMYFSGSIAHIATITCLLFFIITGYNVATNKEFITVNDDDGICIELSRENSGTYLATDTGYWEGSDDYRPSKAIFELEYISLATTMEEYKQLIRLFKGRMYDLGQKALRQDAAYNIMNWMTWEMADPNYLFQLTGGSIDVFNRYYTIAYLATVEGRCDAEGVATYNSANFRLRLEFSVESFRNSSVCLDTAHPQNLGFNEVYDYDSFRIDLDINSCIIAVSVAMRILTMASLTKIPSTTVLMATPMGGQLEIDMYFDNRYGNMAPIFCFYYNDPDGGEEKEACVVKIDNAYALPIMNHFGEYDFDTEKFPTKCDCDIVTAESYCQVFDFMIGAIFYDTESAYPLFELISKHGLERINTLSYNLSADAIEDSYTAAQRVEAYSFCNLSFGPCNVVMFNTYDDISHSVSPSHYQVFYPSCNDTFYIAEEAWTRLEESAPTELVERYFSCTQRPSEAIFNAVGIATGNTALFIPILCLLCLPLLYAYLQLTNNLPPKDDYAKGELDAAEKALALIILRIRDGKLRGIKKGSVLTKLTGELVSAAKTESGFADSDDDSDSDDEEDVERPSPQKAIAGQKKRKSSRRHARGPDGGGGKGSYLQSGIFLASSSGAGVGSGRGGGDNDHNNGDNDDCMERVSEFDLPAVDASDFIVLNIRGDGGKGMNSAVIPPNEYVSAVEGMISLMQRAMLEQGRGEGVGGAAYKEAQEKTAGLCNIHFDKQTDMDARGQLSVKIYNLLLLHISVEFECSMTKAIDEYSFLAAYKIGRKDYSGADLLRMKNQDI